MMIYKIIYQIRKKIIPNHFKRIKLLKTIHVYDAMHAWQYTTDYYVTNISVSELYLLINVLGARWNFPCIIQFNKLYY